jgi:hypothetical protein
MHYTDQWKALSARDTHVLEAHCLRNFEAIKNDLGPGNVGSP